jgi:hypothetical protein
MHSSQETPALAAKTTGVGIQHAQDQWLQRYWSHLQQYRPEASPEWLERYSGIDALALFGAPFADDPEAAAYSTAVWAAFSGL